MAKHIQPGNEPLDPDNVPTYGQWTLVNSKLTILKNLMTSGSSLMTAIRNLINALPPNLVVRNVTGVAYNSGVLKTELFSYVNSDNKSKQFIGTIYLNNFTAAKIITIDIEELDNGSYYNIDKKTYIVGTDPHPHFEFYSDSSIKVYATLNITEGIMRMVPKRISVLTHQR